MKHLMKKGLLILKSTLLCLSVLIIFSNCEVGLGESVDTQAPTLSITYPPASSVIRENFILAGMCDDDTKVTAVVIEVKNTDENNASYGTYNGIINGREWTAEINKNIEGRWNLPDGRYVADVYAIDAVGRKSGVNTLPFDVDNTAPLFILSSPASKDKDNPTAYGSAFKVTGTIADDHTVSEMTVKLFDKDADPETAEPLNGAVWTETNIETAGGTEIVFANQKGKAVTDDKTRQESEELINRYNSIYTRGTGDQEYCCKVITSDCAKIYRDPKEAYNNTKGNTTESFYLYDDVYDEWLSSSCGLDASKVKKIINGTSKDTSISDSTKSQVIDSYNNKQSKKSYFTLNPDANPKYQVFGFGTDNVITTCAKASGGQGVTVNLTAGRNGTKVSPETLAVYQFGPYDEPLSDDDIANKLYGNLAQFTNFYNEQKALSKAVNLSFNGSSEKIPSEYPVDIEADQFGNYASGSVESYNYQVMLTGELNPGSYYYLAVIGTDKEGSYADPLTKIYAFQGMSSSKPPVLYWPSKEQTSIADVPVLTFTNDVSEQGVVVNKAVQASGDILFEGLIKNEDGLGKISKVVLSGQRYEVTATGNKPDGTYDNDITSCFDKSNGKWSCSFSGVTVPDKIYYYELEVTVTNSSRLTDTKTRNFFVDTKLPVIEYNDITPYVTASAAGPAECPYADGDYLLNGTFKLSGSVEDDYLDDVWYEIASEGDRVKSSDFDGAAGHGLWYSFLDKVVIDSTDVNKYKTYNNKEVTIEIHAKDKAGNEAVKSLTQYINEGAATTKKCWINQSSDAPVLTGSNVNFDLNDVSELSANPQGGGAGNVFDTKTSLMGVATDDDGIKTIAIEIKKPAGSWGEPDSTNYGKKLTTQSFTYTNMPTEAGVYDARVIAYDSTYDNASSLSQTEKDQYRRTEKVFKIAIDAEAPTLTEVSAGDSDTKYTKKGGQVTYGGSISDDYKLAALVTNAANDITKSPLSLTIKTPADSSGNKNYLNQAGKIIKKDASTGKYINQATGFEEHPEILLDVNYTGAGLVENKNGSWSLNFTMPDGSDVQTGMYELTFTASDEFGRTSSITRSIYVDATPPVIKMSSVTPSIMKDGDMYLNGTIKVNGTVEENYLDDVWYEVKVDGNIRGTYPDIDPSTGKRFGAKYAISGDDIKIDTTALCELNETKEIDVVIHAKDKAGNEAEYNFGKLLNPVDSTSYKAYISQETDKPVFSSSNLHKVTVKNNLNKISSDDSTGNIFDGTVEGLSINCNLKDDDGIGTENGAVVIDVTNESGISITGYPKNQTLTSESTNQQFEIPLPKDGGFYKAKITAKDVTYSETTAKDATSYRTVTYGPYLFAIDSELPGLTLDQGDSAQFVKKGASVTYTGTISDDLLLPQNNSSDPNKGALKVLIKGGNVNETQPVTVSFADANNKNGTWTYSYTVPENAEDGTYTLTFTATDSYGRTTTELRSITIDTTDPVVTIRSVTPSVSKDNDSNLYLNGTVSVTGTVNEMYLEDVWYEVYVDGVKKTNIVGLNTDGEKHLGVKNDIKNEITIDTTAFGSLASPKEIDVKIKAKDKAGNVGETSFVNYLNETGSANKAYIDQTTDNPVISFSNFYKVTQQIYCQKTSVSESTGNMFDATAGRITINGTVTDDDGISAGTNSITIKVTNADGTPVSGYTNPTFNVNTATTNQQFAFDLPTTGGFYKAYITATDKTYNETTVNDAKNYRRTIYAANTSSATPVGYWFAVDKDTPEIRFDGEAGSTTEIEKFAKPGDIITYSGEISDDLLLPSSGALKVQIKGGNINENHSVDNITFDVEHKTATWTYSYTVPSTVADGKYTFTFTVTDSFERTYTEARSVIIDTTDPVVDIRSVVPEVVEGTAPNETKYLNGTVTITGTVTETYLDNVWYEVKVGGVKVTNLTGADSNGNVNLGAITAINDQIKIDTTKLTDLNEIEVIVHANDKAGNDGEKSTTQFNGGKKYSIKQETDRPKIEASNFYNVTDKSKLKRTPAEGKTDEGNIFDGSSATKLMGSFSDDDGIAEAYLYLYNENGSDYIAQGRSNNQYPLSIKTGATTTAFSFDNLPTVDGIYRAKIVVRDTTYSEANDNTIRSYREATLGEFYFGVDAKPPVIDNFKVNGSAGDEQVFANDTKLITFTGNVSDKLKLEQSPKTLILDIKSSGTILKTIPFEANVSPSDGKQITWDNGKAYNSGTFSYSFKFEDHTDVSWSDGTYEFAFTAEDIYGRTCSISKNIVRDTTAPTTNISSVTPYVKKTVDVSGTPTEITFLNGTFKVSGTVDEVNLENVWFEVKCDGNTVDSRNLTPARNGKWYSFSEEIQIDSTDTTIWKTTDKKPVEVIVHSIDKAGNESTESTTTYNENKSYEIDQSTDKPVITGNNFCLVTDIGNLSTSTDFTNNKGNIFDKTSNNKLIGKVEDDDGIVEIKVIVYNAAGNVQISSTPVTGFTSGTTTAAFTFANLPTTSGVYKVEIVAKDKTYAEAATAEVKANRETTYGPFYISIDSENPDLEETKVNTSDVQYVSNIFGSVEFGGTAKDDWELASTDGLTVSATYKAPEAETPSPIDSLSASIPVTSETGAWTHTVDLKDVAADPSHGIDAKTYGSGLYTFVFTATDKAGKTTSITRKIYKDTVVPVFGTSTITDPSETGYKAENVKPYITTAKNGDWYNTTTLNVSGGVSDVGSGVAKVEYTLDATIASPTWTELAGTSSFGGVIAGVSNGGTITLRVTDVAGNIAVTNITGIKIDIDSPSAVVTEIDGQTTGLGNILTNGQNDIVVKGTANDALSGIASLKIKVADKVFTSPDLTITSFVQAKDSEGEDIPGTYTWEGTIPHLKNGNPYWTSGTVWAQVTDGAGNTADINLFSLQVDTVSPEVEFADTIIDATVNKKITVSGTGSDDQKLALVKLEYKFGSGDDDWKEVTHNGNPVDDTTDPGLTVTGTYNWKLDDLDTEKAFGTTIYDCDSTKAGTQVTLRATATDAAGNTKSEECTITVDQDTDRPKILFTNLGDLSGMTSSNYIFFNNTTMMGNIEDDDGNVSDLKVIIKKVVDGEPDPTFPTDAEWATAAAVSVPITNGAFKCDKLVQGKQAVYFRVTDKKGSVFVSKAAKADDAVYLKDENNTFGDATNGDSALYLKVDTVDPSLYDGLEYNLKLNSDGIYELIPSTDTTTPWATSIETVTFGGTRPYFKLRIFARDDNGIKSVVATMGDSEETQGYCVYDGEETSAGSGIYKAGHGAPFTKLADTKTINVKGQDLEYEIWESPAILTGGNADNGNLKDGITNLKLEVFDNGLRSSSKTLQLSIDNTAPTVNVASPKSTITVSGETNAYGDISEASTMYYAISTSSTVSPDSDAAITTWYENGNASPKTISDISSKISYEEMKDAGKIWYLYFDNDADPSQLYTHTGKTLNDYIIDYGITTAADLNKGADSFADIVELYLWIKAVDETAGNVSETCHKILLDPQGDRPIVEITYPVKDTTKNDIVIGGGNIKVYGGSEARNAKTIQSVWIQLVPKSIHSGSVVYPSNSGILSYRGTTKNHNNDWSTNIAYDTLTDGYKFTTFNFTVEDLDYLADAGYSVYNMNTFVDADHSQKWVHGTSSLAAGEKASDYAALVNLTGTTWNITVNQSGEFNPVKDANNPGFDDTNEVAMRVFARDSLVKFSIPSDIVFKVDNGTPYYGAYQNIYLVQSAETGTVDWDEAWTASREYTEDMFVRGNWYVIGSIEDDQQIKSLSVSNKKTNITENLVVNAVKQASNSNFDLVPINVEGHNGYFFKYRLDTSGEVGEVDLEFIAEDNAEHTGKKEIKLKFDNLKPVLETEVSKGYKLNPSVNNTDNFYKMTSAVKEDNKSGNKQSGFDYVAFYFMRRTSGNVIYDVMESRYQNDNTTVNAANKITIPSNLANSDWIFEDGIYWKKLSVTRDNVLLGKLTLNAADANIHAGGLVKVGGTNYLIDSVSGTEISISGNPPETYTEAYFARGVMVCNNTVTESSGGTLQSSDHGYGYGYYSKPANDDGDRMIESVSNEGTKWTWEASINSKNIPDGPIELHYVAFDKAGNYSVGIMSNVDKTTFSSYTTPDKPSTAAELDAIAYSYESESPAFVSNNRPRIAGVIFGTDNDGDGNVTEESYDSSTGKWNDGEMITAFAGWYMADSESDFYDHDYDFGNRVKGVEHNGKAANGDDIFEFNVPKELTEAQFTIKGRTVVKPEVVGGNNGIKYTYEVRTTNDIKTLPEYISGTKEFANVAGAQINNDSVTEAIRKGVKIDLSLEELIKNEISDGQNKMLTFKIWDNTEGTIAGTNSQFATVNIMADVLLHDEVPPTACITPFFWRKNKDTGALENSLYQNSKDNGHIELEDDWKKLPVYSSADGGIYDGDPKVSGKVVIRGIATDNVRVNTIKLSVKKSGSDGTNTIFNDDAFVTVAERVGTTWQSKTTLADDGIELVPFDSSDECAVKLVKEEFTREANTVYFAIAWDTAMIADVAQSDVEVEVQALDAGKMTTWNDSTGKPNVTVNSASAASTIQTVKTSETPYYKMDVVPYISSIETKNRNNSGLKKNNIRSASGKYSVIKGSTADFITVYGFNLKPTDARIVNTSTAATAVSATSGVGLTVGTVNVDDEVGAYQSVGIKNDGSKSGYLELFVNGIRTLNNVNDNNASGEYEPKKDSDNKILISEYEYLYNREADYNSTKNVRLTDDRYLRFFDMKKTNVVNGYYPTMIMNGDNPVFGYVDNNGGGTGVFSTNAHAQRGEFNGTDGSQVYKEYLVDQLATDQMAMAIDSDKRYYQVTLFNYDGGGLGLYYDRYSQLVPVGNRKYNFNYGYVYNDGDTWGPGTSYIEYQSGKNANSTGNNAITLETTDYNGNLRLGRYETPKIITKGGSKSIAYVYMSYFDSETKEICFRNFRIGSSVTGTNLDNTHKDRSNVTYDQKYNFTENTNNSNTYVTGRLRVATNASKYFTMAVTSTNHVIIIYYDENESRLVMKYSTNAVDGSNPTANVAWTTSTISFPEYVGNYVSMALDSNDGIHIAAFDSGDSDLSYIYIASCDTTPEQIAADTTKSLYAHYTVDQSGAVGNWTQIKVDTRQKVVIDGTETANPMYNKPVIAYTNATENGQRDAIKLAVSNGSVAITPAGKSSIGTIKAGVDSSTKYTTGDWEYMTVPAITPPQGGDSKFQNVCLDFDSAGRPVVGYLGTNLEFGKWVDE